MSGKSLKPPKPKVINFELIPPVDGVHEPEPYKVLRDVRQYHPDIDRARIALAWRKNLKRDKDGHLLLGMCMKATDLQRELIDWDFVILLNREVWFDGGFSKEKKRALVDHELCHADVVRDKDGFPKRDERDRYVWRTRKHDIEEFREIVKRHGCYKADLQEFAKALLDKKSTPLFDHMQNVVEQINAGALDQDGVKVTAAMGSITETSTEERIRTRKNRKQLKGQDAILPDKRTSFPHGHNPTPPTGA